VCDTLIKFGKDPVDYFDRQFFSDSDYMASDEGVTSNDELERMWKKDVVA
jgi:hypothetical protein